MLSVEDTLAEVRTIHKRFPYAEHPVWKGLTEASFTKEQMRALLKQYGIIPLWNHNYHGPLYVICPDPVWRQKIAEVVYEEGTGQLYANGVPHWQLFLNLGAGFGLTPDEMWNTDYIPEAVAIRNYYSSVCTKSFLEGCAAHMLAGEAQGPGLFSVVANAVKNKFGLSDETVSFWTVHDVADEDHSSIGEELLGKFAPTEADRRHVIKVVRQTLEITEMYYDGLYKHVMAH